MPITLNSVSGGVADPYIGDDGSDSSTTFPNAGIEGGAYVDTVLVTPESGYVAVVSTSVASNTPIDTQIPSGDVTSGPLNITFSNSPSDSPFGGTSASGGSALITFSGTIGNVFNDLYWKTMNLVDMTSTTTTSRSITTSGDESLYLYKPSFVRYARRTYTITSVHVDAKGNPATFTYTVLKRVLNLWDINRQRLINIVSQQDSYRTNNYPKERK
jgi:hypothetical protein